MDRVEIENRFGFHKGTTEGPFATAPKHAALRQQFIEFAVMLNHQLPEGREKAVTFTELETTAMWAHKAIASLAPVETDYVSAYPSDDFLGDLREKLNDPATGEKVESVHLGTIKRNSEY